jgi:hypothetical protein
MNADEMSLFTVIYLDPGPNFIFPLMFTFPDDAESAIVIVFELPITPPNVMFAVDVPNILVALDVETPTIVPVVKIPPLVTRMLPLTSRAKFSDTSLLIAIKFLPEPSFVLLLRETSLINSARLFTTND